MSPKDKRPSRGASDSRVAYLFAAARQHHQAGQFGEAERHYQQVIALDRKHVPSLHLLGVLSHQTGRSEAAVELIGKAVALEPNDPHSQYNLALALRALGRNDEALARLGRAIALKPDFADAHLHLGALLLRSGRAAEAVTSFQAAVRSNPAMPEAYLNLANTLLRHGKLNDALGVINRMFELGLAENRAADALALVRLALEAEESADTRTLFVQCVRSLRAVPDGAGIRDLMIRAITEPWGRPADLSAAAASLIRQDHAIAGCIDRAATAWPRRLNAQELFGTTGRAAVMGDRLLAALLEQACIRDIALERFLTNARALLLGEQEAAAPDESLLAFACALARQCFINEYAFDVTEAELARANALRDSVAAACQTGADVNDLKLATLAAYMPLHTLRCAEALAGRTFPEAVDAMIDLQVRQPLAEEEIRRSIRSLTPITDAVSVKVREQYEQNPYPRWITTAPIGEPATLDAYLARFPNFRALANDAPSALIAGCGTGQHVATVALQFTGLNILAIDLSLASLGYAQRATGALGLAGVDYAQADLMNLGGIGRLFDMVNSSGVLHHLADPFAGWRVLLSLLKPGGVMRLGLYSALGRREVTAVREFVALRGYTAEASSIRACRQELMGFAAGTAQRSVAETSDFFSTSECRDLLFHVQEHNLTLPAIADFVAENSLAFLGFEGCARGYQRYAQQHPADRAMADLGRWAEMENADPRLFFNMYQFWVQKPC